MSEKEPQTIAEWASAAHQNSREHGWWPQLDNRGAPSLTTDEVLAKIALMHSELSEALEEVREGRFALTYLDRNLSQTTVGKKPEGAVVEFADVCIRIFDLCRALDLDLEGAIRAKHEYNKGRPFRHGGKRA